MGYRRGALILIALAVLSSLFFLTGMVRNNPFPQHLDALERHINQKEWEVAQQESQRLLKVFNQNKWKLQLLGDEEEYEGLGVDLQQLHAVLEEKDKTESKNILASVRAIVEHIYTL